MVGLISRTRRTRRATAAVAFVIVAILAAVGVASPALAGGKGGGDFTISSWSNPVYLVRGGLEECPQWNCDTNHNWEPRLFSCGYGVGCFYSGTSVHVQSVDGSALGTVDLEILDLPAGVTSETGGQVRSRRSDTATTPFVLAASANAPLGDFVVTVQGSNGNFTREGQRPIRIVDELPPMVQSPTFDPSTVPGGEPTTGTASLSGPAPAGGITLELSTAYSQILTLPESVTVPEGVTSTTFTVETAPVSYQTTVAVLIFGEGTIGNAIGTFVVTP